jgi:hypothetical protein
VYALEVHIFIDEAGSFILRAPTTRYSCIGALVIPSARVAEVEAVVAAFKLRLGICGELKGSHLNETQVEALLEVLAPFDLLFEVTAFDSHVQPVDALHEHKMASAAGMTLHLTPRHHPSLRKQLEELKAELEAYPDQLYTQASLTCVLIHRAVTRAMLYYVQRDPSELASFAWQHDPKAGTPSRRRYGTYDRFFDAVIRPWLQHTSLENPAPVLEGADYSHFQPYLMETPAYLQRPVVKGKERSPFVWDLKKMMADFSFPKSEDSLGLQLVDVLTNAVKRTLNRQIHPKATVAIPRLMVQPMKGQSTVTISMLGGGRGLTGQDTFAAAFVKHCNRYAKPMIP